MAGFLPQTITAPRESASAENLRRAAVAVIFLSDEAGRACYVLTRRAAHLRRHSGQLALPGGRVDEGETPTETAIRETEEEIGLMLHEDQILGCLDHYATRSGFVMMPVVFWGGENAELAANPAEVQEIMKIPVSELDREDAPRLFHIPESDAPVIQMPIFEGVVNAPTAAVLYQLREVALHGRHTRVAHFEQPVWAWK